MRRRARTAALGVTLGLAVIIAGGPGEPRGEAAGDLGTVAIGKAADTIGFAIADVAVHEGFFERRGVHAEIAALGNSTVANAALSAGSVQFAMASATALLLARSKGLPLIAVAEQIYGASTQLMVRKKLLATASVNRQTPVRQRLQILQNAVLAVSGPTAQGAFASAFQMVGLEAHPRYVILRNQEAAAAAMRNDQIDGFFGSPPAVFQLVADGVGVVLLSGREIPGWEDAAYDVTITTHTYAQAHPEITRAVAQAIGQADDFVREHREAALVILGQHYRGLGRPVLTQTLNAVTFAEHGRMTQRQWAAALRLAIAQQFAPATYQIREGVDWTNAYLQEQ